MELTVQDLIEDLKDHRDLQDLPVAIFRPQNPVQVVKNAGHFQLAPLKIRAKKAKLVLKVMEVPDCVAKKSGQTDKIPF